MDMWFANLMDLSDFKHATWKSWGWLRNYKDSLTPYANQSISQSISLVSDEMLKFLQSCDLWQPIRFFIGHVPKKNFNISPTKILWFACCYGGQLGHLCLLIFCPYMYIFLMVQPESSSLPLPYFTHPLLHSCHPRLLLCCLSYLLKYLH
jgi:hypothetical protein